MATAQLNSQPQLQASQLTQEPIAPVPIKCGLYGPQGSGKSTSAALLAAAISAQFYSKGPVFVVDPEAAWQFLKRRIFDVEGIELIQRPYSTFKDMVSSLHEAEKIGACCWIVDPLTLIWNELLDSFKQKLGYIPIDKWQDVRQLWNGDYIRYFLNCNMNCLALGRLGNDFEEREETLKNGETKTKLVKVGTKFKAGGGESFGYEPHLLLELSLERKNRKVNGQEREGEGRMVHRADVLKDRTWALNGRTFRWSDKAKYERGGFRQVWESIRLHFEEVQATMQRVSILPGNSQSLISDSGDSEFYHQRQRKEAISAEIKACLDLYFAGRGKEEVQVRLAVSNLIWGVKSKEAADQLPLEQLERGLRILHAYEKLPSKKLDDRARVLEQITECIQEYDRGESEVCEQLPF
jgi:hypothetical protein